MNFAVAQGTRKGIRGWNIFVSRGSRTFGFTLCASSWGKLELVDGGGGGRREAGSGFEAEVEAVLRLC